MGLVIERDGYTPVTELEKEITSQQQLRDQAKAVKAFLEFLPFIRMHREDALWELKHLVKLLTRYGQPEKIGEYLIELVGGKPVEHGDHEHWVIYKDPRYPEREGPLVTVSRIGPKSNRNPDRHTHPENCIEFTVPLNTGLESVTSDTKYGQPEYEKIEPLVPHEVKAQKFHSACNNSHHAIIYIDWRAVISK